MHKEQMNPSGFAGQIHEFIKQNQRNTKVSSPKITNIRHINHDQITINKNIDYLNDKMPENSFLLIVQRAICCVREMTWQEKADIQAQAFNNYGEDEFYNELFEMREVISQCIYWIYDIEEDILVENNVSKVISGDFAEEFWFAYQDYYEVSAEEAGLLYNSASDYFKNSKSGTIPVPAIVLEVDDLMHFVSLPYNVYLEMGCIKYQKIKIILMARTHALALQGESNHFNTNYNDNSDNFDEHGGLPAWMFPPKS